ncbi:MAG: glycine cleavage system aminomethyltransferase GcvT [Candidatus Zapsychrus exili]|nr:glycine cleavage system aminomethyltransferase GcvT [Candidatus Zapsychrus exili]
MIEKITLKKTPLYESHIALSAKMVDFGGWEMPVQYEGILAEYKYTREQATLFDISHMGEFIVEGDCVESGLDSLLTMSVSDMPIKSCRYGCMLNEDGGVIDDLIVFREDKDKWFLVVNSATTEKDKEHVKSRLSSKACFKDVSESTAKLDLQGPRSREILSSFVDDVSKLDYYTFDYFQLLGENVIISRTGYTGELGYEIYYPADKVKVLWNALLEDGKVKPAGLGARDVLRLEMGYSLYGHELGEDVSPLESGLSRFVDLNKNFIGKDVITRQKQEGLKRKIVGFVSSSRRSPRAEQKIYAEDKEIGVVTSGTFSPEMERGIGLGFVLTEHADRDNKILFGNENKREEAVVSSKLFYKRGSLKK